MTTADVLRLTVSGPRRRTDLALPGDVPVALLLPEIGRLARAEAPGTVLLRLDGTRLDPELPLPAQRVRDGDLLLLRPMPDGPPPAPRHDDIADALAAGAPAARSPLRPAVLAGVAAVLTALAAALARGGAPPGSGTVPGTVAAATAVLLLAAAPLAARRGRRGVALALGLPAPLHAALAAALLLRLHPPAPLAAAAGLGTAAVLAALVPGAATLAAAALAAAGTGAALALGPGGLGVRPVAAVALAAATVLLPLLPGAVLRAARLDPEDAADRPGADTLDRPDTADAPVDPVDLDALAARRRRADALLTGLTATVGVVAAAAVAALLLAPGAPAGDGTGAPAGAAALAAGCAAALALHARRMPRGRHACPPLAAALAVPVLAVLRAPASPVLAVLAALGGAALLCGALAPPARGPLAARLLEGADAAARLLPVPLCVVALGLPSAAWHWASAAL
ncbi:type VII secretion integral membrane protein EccD [Mangrovactinospora gilvigrisea]|uniref:Type VII secretion integral membrane protein EccD n=1 Tax=Mangrovactinospora gilvigrisea TaxID=1428644 RepID=A0A1J7BSG7_9ACTN|nr:type VII secretion integral membrane protein EccD [Mangrovactinospora gilvigrisea]OIV36401.1 type VII secretion integral membrane protein EccD [Mangrovactinospora gilvigrisea]